MGTVFRIRTGDGAAVETLHYDHLVVGTGAREPMSEVAGLREFGSTLRGPDEIGVLADRLGAASGSPVVVAGGGVAGVELAAAIADRGHPVTLVHSAARVLGEWDDQPRLVARAEAELARLGVIVLTGRRLVQVTSSAARLSDGTLLPSGTVVVATGQRPVRIPGLDRWRDERGRLRTHPSLAVTTGVWAAGDAALVRHPVTQRAVPANALWAVKGGDHIGRAIARELRGTRARRFGFRGLGRAASFGVGKAIAELYGIPLTGEDRVAAAAGVLPALHALAAPRSGSRRGCHAVPADAAGRARRLGRSAPVRAPPELAPA